MAWLNDPALSRAPTNSVGNPQEDKPHRMMDILASKNDVPSVLLVAIIWFLPVSPYLGMAADSLRLVTGKSLRMIYAYSLVVLSIMTLIMLASLQRRMEFMAMGNLMGASL